MQHFRYTSDDFSLYSTSTWSWKVFQWCIIARNVSKTFNFKAALNHSKFVDHVDY